MAGKIIRLKGTVRCFHISKCFGFIAPEHGEEDLFVSKSLIKAVGFNSLTVGDTVEFVVSVGDDGRAMAVNVTDPSGAYIKGRMYFGGDCYSGILACYSRGENGRFAGDFPAAYFELKILFDGLSESMNSDDEEEEFSGVEERNWAELPRDVLSVIFKKIGAVEILTSAQFVCRLWRQLSYDPDLWRCIDMTYSGDSFDFSDLESMAMMAVSRSEGCLEKFYAHYFVDNQLMGYIADRATQLRCLRLISVDHTSSMGLFEAVRRFPLLEEFEILFCFFSDDVVELIGQACPQLKSFVLNAEPYMFQYDSDSDSDGSIDTVALAIAGHMNQLCRLQLLRNSLTNIGLFAILNNCPYLEYLDIRGCLNVDVDENLMKKCARIKDLRLPNDCTSDYEFDENIGGLETNNVTEYDQYDDYTCHDYNGFCGLNSEDFF